LAGGLGDPRRKGSNGKFGFDREDGNFKKETCLIALSVKSSSFATLFFLIGQVDSVTRGHLSNVRWRFFNERLTDCGLTLNGLAISLTAAGVARMVGRANAGKSL